MSVNRLAAAIAAMVAFVSLGLPSSAHAQQSRGQCKLLLSNGRPVVGEVIEYADRYEVVTTGKGGKGTQRQTFAKSEVRSVEPLDAAAGGAEGANRNARTLGERGQITDAMIAEILGSDSVSVLAVDSDDQTKVDLASALEPNESSIKDMLRIAGPKAKRHETDHFVFVYTSELSLAKEMAANLERVYRWVGKFNELMGVKSTRPENKLEIFFFGTYDEYQAYQSLNGFIAMGAIGFYQPNNNRSAFFNMHTWPPVANLHERLKNAPPDQRREIENKIKRQMDHLNREVVQHEAGHHIHFNLGVFPRRALGNLPRWAVEGLAQMFEVVSGDAGASFGALNHYRLYQFRQIYGNDGERIPDMRVVLLNDGWWFAMGANAYPMGWALNHYLGKSPEHKDNYRKWMQLLAGREEDEEITITELQRQFEVLFGEINDEWTKKFVEFMKTLQLKMSEVPDP